MNLTTRQIEKTIKDLEAKHQRQSEAADNTKAQIEAFRELITMKDKPEAPNATRSR